MAVTISLSTQNRGLDTIGMTVEGALNTTVASTRVAVVDPSLNSYTVNLSPEEFSVPTSLPITRDITAAMLGLTTFEDGVYSFTYTVNYTDLSNEITPAAYLLFDNNTIIAWVGVMQKHIGLDCICVNEPEQVKRTEARELINASQEFFELARYDDAKKSLETAQEFLSNC